MFCKECGTELDENNVCPNCGKTIEHPAGSFMWSFALGGPIIAWFFHRKELKSSNLSFIWPMIGWNFLLDLPDRALSRLTDMFEPADTIGIYSILGIIWFFISIFILGKLGAARIKKCLPVYNHADYKRHEKYGITTSIIFLTIVFVLFLLWGIYSAQ